MEVSLENIDNEITKYENTRIPLEHQNKAISNRDYRNAIKTNMEANVTKEMI